MSVGAVHRLEVIPLPGIVERVTSVVPAPTRLTVTCSPKHGLGPTLDVTSSLVSLGYEVVPHVAARMVPDRHALRALVSQLLDLGVDDVFVIGGDSHHPLGTYASGEHLLGDLAEEAEGALRFGIAGYPEGHPSIPAHVLANSLHRKARHASYLATQMCFDMRLVTRWLRDLRAGGFALPAFVGVPGVVKRAKLIEISARIGVGSSLRYIRKNRRAATHLLAGGSYGPGQLLEQLAAEHDAALGIGGIHIFTFNQLESTHAWLVAEQRDGGVLLPRRRSAGDRER